MINNSNNKRVVIITGPSGAGKSTISRGLATELGSCVDIDIEHVNYMIVGGFEELNSDGKSILTFSKWSLAGDSIGLLAENFMMSGLQVIIHGHVNEELLLNIEKRVKITDKFLLLPNLETVITRDGSRGKYLTMGENMVREHYDYFLSNKWDNFIVIDSTHEGVNITRDTIKDKLHPVPR